MTRKNDYLVALTAFIMGVALLSFFACDLQAQTVPKWIAINPSAGFVSCYDTSVDDGKRLSLIEITAATDIEISFWRGATVGAGVWTKTAPLWGFAAGDTTISIAAGVTKTFRFEPPYVNALYFSGSGNFSGE